MNDKLTNTLSAIIVQIQIISEFGVISARTLLIPGGFLDSRFGFRSAKGVTLTHPSCCCSKI
jgi:hypothetical protein